MTEQPTGTDAPSLVELWRGICADFAGTTVRLAVPDDGRRWTVRVVHDGRASRVDDRSPADETVVLGPEDFVVLAGGRRTPEATAPRLQGDSGLGRQVLRSLAVTP